MHKIVFSVMLSISFILNPISFYFSTMNTNTTTILINKYKIPLLSHANSVVNSSQQHTNTHNSHSLITLSQIYQYIHISHTVHITQFFSLQRQTNQIKLCSSMTLINNAAIVLSNLSYKFNNYNFLLSRINRDFLILLRHEE